MRYIQVYDNSNIPQEVSLTGTIPVLYHSRAGIFEVCDETITILYMSNK